MRPVEDIERDLARVTAERDALARHVERLIAPVTAEEVSAALARTVMRDALTEFIAKRQRSGQFAAFS